MTTNQDLRCQSGYLQINDKFFPIYKGVNIIGRDLKATVSLTDVILSKLHAIISVVDTNTHLISDLRSANATKLGNVKLKPYQYYAIRDQDVITFGNLAAVYYKNTPCPVSNQNNTKNSTESHGCDYEAPTQVISEHTTPQNNIHEAETQISACDFKKPATNQGKVHKINSTDIHDQPTHLKSSDFHEVETEIVENDFKPDDTDFNNDLTQVVPLKSVLNHHLAAAGDNEQNTRGSTVNDSAIFDAATQAAPSGFAGRNEHSIRRENEVTLHDDDETQTQPISDADMETQPNEMNFSNDKEGGAKAATQNFNALSPIHCYDDIFANESFRKSLERSISKYDVEVDETVIGSQSLKTNDDEIAVATQPIGFKRKNVKPLTSSDDSEDAPPVVTQPIGFKRKNAVPLPASDDSDDIVMGTQDVTNIEMDIARSELNCAKNVVEFDSDSATDEEDCADISKKVQEMNKGKEKTESGSETDVDEDLTTETSSKNKNKSDYESDVDEPEESEETSSKERTTIVEEETTGCDSSTDVEDNLLTDVAVNLKDKEKDNSSDAETQVAELNLVQTKPPAQDKKISDDNVSDAETDVEDLNLPGGQEEDSATDVEDSLIENKPEFVEKKVNVREDNKRSETPQVNHLGNDSDTDVEEDLLQSVHDNNSEGTLKDALSIESRTDEFVSCSTHNSKENQDQNDSEGVEKPMENKKSNYEEDGPFLQPTQMLEPVKLINVSAQDAEPNELPPTQLLTESFNEADNRTSNIQEDDLFLQPTQILEPAKLTKPLIEDAEQNGLPPTQLLTESFNEADNRKSNIEEDDLFLQPTQILEPAKLTKPLIEDAEQNKLPPTQLLTESFNEADNRKSNIQEDDLFLQPTQILEPAKLTKPLIEDAEQNELPPTQLLTESFNEADNRKSNIQEDDLFLQPTQILEPAKLTKPFKEDAEQNELPPTQLLTESFNETDNRKSNTQEDDLFLQPTQILEPGRLTKPNIEDAEPNELPPTQLLTESFTEGEQKSDKEGEDDLFLKPTQVLHLPMDVEEKDDVFLQPTQMLPEDIYNLPTQKMPDINKKKQTDTTQRLSLESSNQSVIYPLDDSQGSLRLHLSEDSIIEGRDSLENKKVDTSAAIAIKNPSQDVETQLEVNFELETQVLYIEEKTKRPGNPLGQMFSDEETQETQNEGILSKDEKLKAELLSDIENGLQLVPVVAMMDLTKSKITLKDIQDASTSKTKKGAVKVQKPKIEPTRKSRRNQSTSSKIGIATESINKDNDNDDNDDEDETETVEETAQPTKTTEKTKSVRDKKCEASNEAEKQKHREDSVSAVKPNKTKDKEHEDFAKPEKPHNTRGKRLNYKSLVSSIDEEELVQKQEEKISKKVQKAEENEVTVKPRARGNKRKNSVPVQSKIEDSEDEDFIISTRVTKTPRKRTLDHRKEDEERVKNGMISINEDCSESSVSSTDRRKRTKVLKITSSEETEMTASTCTDESVARTPRRYRTPRNIRTPKRSLPSTTSSEESLATTAASSASVFETPSKKRRNYEPLNIQVTSESTNATISVKHKVVFTMLSDDSFKTYVKNLGGTVIEKINSCTVLVTNKISRSLKFLLAMALGKPIVDVNWIDDSLKEGRFLDPWDYLLHDPEMEKKLDMNLKKSLKRSCERKLFSGETILLAVNKNFDVLKDIIETSGAKCVSRIPTKVHKLVVVAYEEERSKYSRFLKQKTFTVVSAEAIFCGVLKQELNFNKYLLS